MKLQKYTKKEKQPIWENQTADTGYILHSITQSAIQKYEFIHYLHKTIHNWKYSVFHFKLKMF